MSGKNAFPIFILLAVILGGGWFFTNQLGAPRKVATVPVSIADSESILAPTSPTLITSKTSNVHSPDGKKDLIMERQIRSDDSITYYFYTADVSGENKKLIFTKVLGANKLLLLPNNSWSPDNKYFFLKENDGGMLTAYVFNAAGDPLSDAQFIDVGPVFTSKNTGNVLSDITGWDSPTLLHIFSNAADGTSGPSYWFEIPSTAVIQLASR